MGREEARAGVGEVSSIGNCLLHNMSLDRPY